MAFFDRSFRKEDLFLYLVTLGLLIFLGYYFVQSRNSILSAVQFSRDKVPAEYNILFESSGMKYEFASKVLAANSMRNNMSFLVGTFLCVLGTMIVVRRLRDSIEVGAQQGTGNFSVKTSSPGIFLCLIGGVLIILSVILKDKYEVTEGSVEAIIPAKTSTGKDTLKNTEANKKDSLIDIR